jgi:hypothetical protein
VAKTTDPLGDAITVLENVRIENPSKRLDTEDAANRVALALGYLRMIPRGEDWSGDGDLEPRDEVEHREFVRRSLEERGLGGAAVTVSPDAQQVEVLRAELLAIASGLPSTLNRYEASDFVTALARLVAERDEAREAAQKLSAAVWQFRRDPGNIVHWYVMDAVRELDAVLAAEPAAAEERA